MQNTEPNRGDAEVEAGQDTSRVGAGDDCAVIGKPRDKRWQLLKADAVVEGVHFLATDEPHRVDLAAGQ